MIGYLMYLTATRPHVLYDLSVLSRFLNSFSELHIQAAKRVLKYITGPMDYDMKSTSGYGFIFGAGYVSCCSKKKERLLLNQLQQQNSLLLQHQAIKLYG